MAVPVTVAALPTIVAITSLVAVGSIRYVIIKVSCCAICGSHLHLMDGLMPTMKSVDILGH